MTTWASSCAAHGAALRDLPNDHGPDRYAYGTDAEHKAVLLEEPSFS